MSRISHAKLQQILTQPGYGIAPNSPLIPTMSNLGGSRKTPQWSPGEDLALTQFYKSARPGSPFIIDPLVKSLGRSRAAIHCRANALRLTFKSGTYPRKTPAPKASEARFTDAERKEDQSKRAKEWHRTHRHPMEGQPVPNSTRQLISAANKGRKVTDAEMVKRLTARQQTASIPSHHRMGSWKAGWRVIAGRRIYARSRWEANYARYLQFLKEHGQIQEWEHEPETFWFGGIKRGVCSYLPDFRVTYAGGRIEYHECKGWMDARSKTKLRRMAKYHPEIKLRLITGDWFRSQRLKLRAIIPEWEDGKL